MEARDMKPTRVMNSEELKKLSEHLGKIFVRNETLIWKNDDCFDIWRNGHLMEKLLSYKDLMTRKIIPGSFCVV